MSSILKVDTIQDQSGNNIINENANTITIGASGDTITIPSGATIDASGATLTLPTTIEVDTIEPQSGTSLTLGASGDTITIPSGATIANSGTATGFGGITEIDMYLHTNNSLADGVTFTNWSRRTILSGMPHGTGVSHSSGVFTFPSTGIYRVDFQSYIQKDTPLDFVGVSIMGSTDGFVSNETVLINMYGSISTNEDHDCLSVFYIYNVANTSNNKIKFKTASAGTCFYYEPLAIFTKLT